MKKILALLLALLMFVIPLMSCDQLGAFMDTPYDGGADDDDDDDDDRDPKESSNITVDTNDFGEIVMPDTGLDATDEFGDPIYPNPQKPGFTVNPEDSEDPGYSNYPQYSEDPGYNDYPQYSEYPGYSDYPQYSEDPGYSDYPQYSEDPGYSDYPDSTDGTWYPETESHPGLDTEFPNYTQKDETDYPYYPEYPEYTDTETELPIGTIKPETDEYGQETFTSPNDYESISGDPDVDGETITILVREQLSAMREWYKDFSEDEVDEVIEMRNDNVFRTLGVEVSFTLLGNSYYEDCLNAFNVAIMEDVDNDFHYYDVAANYAYAGANASIRNYLANMADTDVFPYFDFSLPCWNQSMVNTTLIDDQLYYITGDLNLSTFDKTMVVFVNKDLYNDNKTADDPEDLQDVALEGKWDYEDLYKWASVYKDTGDGVPSHDDFYGISAGFDAISLDALPYAWDLEFLVTEADGSHSYNIEGNTKIEMAIDKAKALFSGHAGGDRVALADGVGNWNNTGNCTFGGYSEPISHFATGTSVFAIHLLYSTSDDNSMLRNMEYEFGLLPMPKYDEDQANYGTTAYESYTLMTVIDHSDSSIRTKGKAISAYLQLSSEESYTNVRGYYINEIVKQKYFGLNQSVEKSQDIFDIIADNVEFEFISIYAPQLNNVLNSCWREVITGDNNVGASTAEEAFTLDQFSYEAALEEVDSWLGLI